MAVQGDLRSTPAAVACGAFVTAAEPVSGQRVTAITAAITVVLSLLGTVSLTSPPSLRAAADLTALAVLAAYLAAPRLPSRGPARAAEPGLESGTA